MGLGVARDRDQPVVPDPVLIFLPALPSLERAEQPASDHAARHHRGVHENQHVQGIAVLTMVAGTNPKSYGKTIPSGRAVASSRQSQEGTYLYLFRLPFGVSMTILRSPVLLIKCRWSPTKQHDGNCSDA